MVHKYVPNHYYKCPDCQKTVGCTLHFRVYAHKSDPTNRAGYPLCPGSNRQVTEDQTHWPLFSVHDCEDSSCAECYEPGAYPVKI